MTKTILTQVDGFTPCIDSIVQEYGIITAAVFGVIWRYCQMKDNTCWASQETIGETIGITRQSVCEHTKKLVESGYLEIINSPSGSTIHYKDTGKAGVSIRITGGVNDIDRGCKRNLQGGVNDIDTKIEFKDSKEDSKEEVPPQRPNIYTIYEKEVGGLTGMISEELDEIDKTYPGWFEDAVREAKISSTRVNLKYIESILKRWKEEGKNSRKKDYDKPAKKYITKQDLEAARQ
jgi:DnaD/phage-associated family protein